MRKHIHHGYLFITNRWENFFGGRLGGTEWDNRISPLKDTICHEDLQHIKAIEETNVGTTSLKILTEIFYKTLMKPVQGHFNENAYFRKFGLTYLFFVIFMKPSKILLGRI